MVNVLNISAEKLEIYNRLINFIDFKTSADKEQRKVWNEWFRKLEDLDAPLAHELMNDLLNNQYKAHGEVWQGRLRKNKRK